MVRRLVAPMSGAKEIFDAKLMWIGSGRNLYRSKRLELDTIGT